MRPTVPVPSTSFASNQHDIRTPTISNHTTPSKTPPALSLDNPEIPTKDEKESSRTNGHRTVYSTLNQSSSLNPKKIYATPRQPRFSSPTASPIVVQRPLLVETTSSTAAAFFHSGGDYRHQLRSAPALKKDRPTDPWNSRLGLEPSLASNVGGLPLFNVNNSDWILKILPFLFACDLFKTGVPIKLLRRTLARMLQAIRQPTRQLLSPKVLVAKPQRPPPRNQLVGLLPVQIRGIPNYGQTCFLNSVLQALASLEPYLKYLERIIQVKEEIPQATAVGDPSCFSRQVLDILETINGNGNGSGNGGRRRPDPRNLLKRIGETNAQFRSKYMEQQDAQELLQALLGVVITDAQLDSTSASEQHLRFVLDDDDEDEEETLTAVIAGDETRYSVDWSPANSLSGITPFGESSVLSLSCLLQRIDEGQKNFQLREKQNDAEAHEVLANNNNNPIIVEENTHQREEKKQEDFEISVPFEASEEDFVLLGQQHSNSNSTSEAMHLQIEYSSMLSDNDNTASITATDDQSFTKESKLSTSMQIMKSTISSITPSPLSGWLGSTLRCCNCKHVRPIQNAPFLDIPVVPTSVPNYLAQAHNPTARPSPPNLFSLRPCTLDQCLADFTSVERVQDVECRSCTIQKEVEQLDEEALLLRGAIDSTEKRIKQKGGDPSDQVKYLHEDLLKVELRLIKLRTMDPDEDSSLLDQPLDSDDLLGVGGTETPQKKKSLIRCDAKKCLFLTRCPSVLCCHIQRRYFDPSTNRMEKCVQFVEFPPILDLSPYCAYGPRASTPWAAGSLKQQHDMGRSDVGGKMPYRLQSIIEHRGNAYGGHYVSYRRDHSGEWFRISDNNVTPVSWRQVRTCQAYMLFYEAI